MIGHHKKFVHKLDFQNSNLKTIWQVCEKNKFEILRPGVRLRVGKVLAPPQRPLKRYQLIKCFPFKKIDENDFILINLKTFIF